MKMTPAMSEFETGGEDRIRVRKVISQGLLVKQFHGY